MGYFQIFLEMNSPIIYIFTLSFSWSIDPTISYAPPPISMADVAATKKIWVKHACYSFIKGFEILRVTWQFYKEIYRVVYNNKFIELLNVKLKYYKFRVFKENIFIIFCNKYTLCLCLNCRTTTNNILHKNIWILKN